MTINKATKKPRRITRRIRQFIRPQAPHGRRIGWAQTLLLAVIVLAFVNGFLCTGNSALWLELGLVVLSLTLLTAAGHRRNVFAGVRILWDRLKRYRATRGRLPWASTLTFAVIPAAVLYLSNGKTGGCGDTRAQFSRR